MQIELRNIKVLLANSEETYCYNAALYVDGVRIGDVSNDGRGGCDRFWGDQRAYAAADTWAKANLPPVALDDVGLRGKTLPQSLEGLCHEAVGAFLARRDMTARLRRRVVFVRDGKLMESAFKGVKLIEPRHVLAWKTRNPGDVVLNGMPEDEALALWRNPAAAKVREAV